MTEATLIRHMVGWKKGQLMHVLQSDAPLIVYVDIKSPYAFVAIRPTLALEAELGLQFEWRPLTLDIPSYLGSAEKKKGKVVASEGRSKRTWNAIRYSYRDARRYAERQGLMLKGTEKIWDSTLPNIGILWGIRWSSRWFGFRHFVLYNVCVCCVGSIVVFVY